MNLIDANDVDWEKYSQEYPDSAHVIPAEFYADAVREHFHGESGISGVTLPWSKTHGDIRFRPGELTLWNGVNGHGKSLVLGQVMLGVIQQKHSVCIASMEMKPVLTMSRLARQAIGVNQPSEEAIEKFHRWLGGSLWLYDQVGTITPKRILAVLRYCNEALFYNGERRAIHHFVIDSLLKCGIAEDDYNGQKAFMDKLSAFAHDTGMHIHLVTHARKGESEHHTPGKWDIRGAGAISDLAENVFTVWRNKAKEEQMRKEFQDEMEMQKPDALLICDKQRNGEWEGRIALWFHPASLQYVASQGLRPIPFFNMNDDDENRLDEIPEIPFR